MKKQSLVGLFALTLILLASACKNSDKFQTTDNGLEYKYIVKSDTGVVAGEGGYLEAHIVAETHLDSVDKDTVLISSYNSGYGLNKMLVGKPTYKGCINEGFAMLKAGDSAVFNVTADSLYQKTFNQPLPPFLTGKEIIKITVKVLVSKDKEGFDKLQQEEKEKATQARMKVLEKEQGELKAAAEKMGYGDKLELSPSGLYYVKLKETNNATAKKGDVCSYFYKGMYLDGSEFESNFGGTPFNVTIGSGGAISGWLEVVDKIKKGEKWLVFIPSSMAYGEKGSGKIGPNTPLIFEMELGDIKTAAQAKKEKEEQAKKLSSAELQSVRTYTRGKNFTKDGENEIYYLVMNPGKGKSAKAGENIAGNLRTFDLKGAPIKEFTMQGSNSLQTPFDKTSLPPSLILAISKLNEGGTIKVVSSSKNFQGEGGAGGVAPFTPVMFEFELLSVDKEK